MNCMKSMENMKKDSPDGLSFFDRREYYEASDHLWNLDLFHECHYNILKEPKRWAII